MTERWNKAHFGPIAQAIIDADRHIRARRDRMIDGNVIRFGSHADMIEHRETLRDRQTLRTVADRTWGRPLRDDGAGRA